MTLVAPTCGTIGSPPRSAFSGDFYAEQIAAASAATLTRLSAHVFSVGVVTLVALTSAWAGPRTIYSFKGGSDGSLPFGSLISDSEGNLYGTTGAGGEATAACNVGILPGCGTVFELVKNATGYQEQILYSFQGGNDGIQPRAGLTMDAAGNLYGTTIGGGGSANCFDGCGIVFELAKGSNGQWTESVLYTFQGSAAADGQGPQGQLLLDAQGNLYGTAEYGGGSTLVECNLGCGLVFRLTPTASGPWTETILYSFTDNGDGGYPAGNLSVDASGNLYGTTQITDDKEDIGGTVFELSPSAGGTWTLNTLFTFSPLRTATTGVTPLAGVTLDAQGNLYGTTLCGGSGIRTPGWSPCTYNYGYGNVFKLSPGADGVWTEQILYTFYNLDGAVYPYSALVFDSAGNLYGTTPFGSNLNGVVFKLMPTTSGEWTVRVPVNFSGDVINGEKPYSAIMIDQSGNLFGTTYEGGKNGYGTVYAVNP